MTPINFNHLFYFYMVAIEGGVTKASKRLNLTPQTVSGQIGHFEKNIGVELFDRKGKKLILSEMGKTVFKYAEDIFQLGSELERALVSGKTKNELTFIVGITDVIPKVLAYKILSPVLLMGEQVRLICTEGEQENLLENLVIDKLDMILTDQPLHANSTVRAYNHQLAESSMTFFASPKLNLDQRGTFPDYLDKQMFLISGKKAAMRQHLTFWFELHNISPEIVAEFDDSALLKSFGQAGYGVFAGPSLIEKEISSQYQVDIIGRAKDLKERYYAITSERKLKHPAILTIVEASRG